MDHATRQRNDLLQEAKRLKGLVAEQEVQEIRLKDVMEENSQLKTQLECAQVELNTKAKLDEHSNNDATVSSL